MRFPHLRALRQKTPSLPKPEPGPGPEPEPEPELDPKLGQRIGRNQQAVEFGQVREEPVRASALFSSRLRFALV